MNLPKNYSEIKIKDFIDITYIKKDLTLLDVSKYIEILIILSKTNIEDIYNTNIEVVVESVEKLKFLQSEPSSEVVFELNDYKLINFDDLSLGTFIDLEYYFSNDYLDNIAIIASIMYRKYNNNKYEDYNYNLNNRKTDFENESINNVYGIIPLYLNYRKNIITKYSNILTKEVVENTDDYIETLDNEEKETYKKELETEKEKEQFSWENILYKISNGDLTKYNKIFNMPLIQILNHLNYLKVYNL